MIAVKRDTVPPPVGLTSKRVMSFTKEVRAWFDARSLATRRQERYEFPRLTGPLFDEVWESLKKLFSNKCAYCESALQPGQGGWDRFRPKSGAVGLKRDYSPDHYWWLSYEWQNLYAACGRCNKNKGAKFPVEGSRARLKASWKELAKEQRLLIDPCADDPAQELEFLENGHVRPRTLRGDVTIAVFALNRRDLVRGRRQVALQVRKTINALRHLTAGPEGIDVSGSEGAVVAALMKAPAISRAQRSALEQLRDAASAAAVHAAVARALIRGWLSHLAPQQASGQTLKKGREARHVRLRTQHITAIQIRGFRGLANLDLDVQAPDSEGARAPWLMLLGENGTGKSSVLQAVALTLCGAKGAGARPRHVLRHNHAKGHVRVHLSENEKPLELSFSRGGHGFAVAGEPYHGVVLAYGATRLLPRTTQRFTGRGAMRIRNLFDPFRALVDADRWLSRLPRPTFDYVARALKDLLSLPASSRLKRVSTPGGVKIKLRMCGTDLELDKLSDGYQSVLGLTCDIIAGLLTSHHGTVEDAEGIVLIDELGAHLHPKWRMRIVASLRRAFRRVQFIMSTHDPLCLRGLENGEVVVLQRTERGRVFKVPDIPPVQGLQVDQLLTSEYFGLGSTLDPALEEDFEKLYRLLALRHPTDAEQEEVRALQQRLKPLDPPGATRRERRLLEIIDTELAKLDEEPNTQARAAIAEEAQAQVAADLQSMLSEPAAEAAP